MDKNNLEHADKLLFDVLDRYQVHFLYWVIIALIVKLLS